jgi:hypothetical protein
VRATTLCLVLGGLLAAACSPQPAVRTDAERLAEGKAILQRALTRVAAAQTVTFEVAQEITRDGDGGARKVQKVANVVHLRRPDRLHLSAKGDLERDFWYDGATATIALHKERVFGQAPMPPTADEALDAIMSRYDVPVPLGDLLFTDAPKTLVDAAVAGGLVGMVDLQGVQVAHLSFTTGDTTWQLWVRDGAEPLIMQAHLEYAARKGKPTHHMVFSNWKFGDAIADDMFVATFADDYEGIAMLQRAQEVTEARDSTAIAPAAPGAAAPAPAAQPASAPPTQR